MDMTRTSDTALPARRPRALPQEGAPAPQRLDRRTAGPAGHGSAGLPARARRRSHASTGPQSPAPAAHAAQAFADDPLAILRALR